MKYNAVTYVKLSGGSAFVGSAGDLRISTLYAVQGQSVFTIAELISATLFLVFVDGVKYDLVTTLDPLIKGYTFNTNTGLITLSDPQDAGVSVSYFYKEAISNVISQPEPVTLAEAKDWARITGNDEDAIITNLITAAREIVEKHTNLSLIVRTVTATVINGLGGQRLPYGPVVSLVSGTNYNDEALVLTDYFNARNELKQEFTTENIFTYTAGYSVIPIELKQAILSQVDWMYNNRGSDQKVVEPPYKTQLTKYVA